MNDATADALARLNQRFYDASGEAFGATRRRGWRGWKRLVPHFDRGGDAAPAAHDTAEGTGETVRVLDLGCGNGRLVGFLREEGIDVDYLGLDASHAMLAQARACFGDTTARFEFAQFHREFSRIETATVAGAGSSTGVNAAFDLVAIFGVMHHVPGLEHRARFLEAAWSRVAAGGLAAISWWRFQRDSRFPSRCLAWDDAEVVDDATLRALDRGELEEGDTLLRFGEEPGPPRYCHFASDEEIETHLRWLVGAGAIAVERYDDDGDGRRLNHYALLRRAPLEAR